MAAKKRRRSYTFMSEMPQSTQENNDHQEVDTNVSAQNPTEQNQDTRIASTLLGGDSSQELNRNNNTTDASVQSSLGSRGPGSSTSNDVRNKRRGQVFGYQEVDTDVSVQTSTEFNPDTHVAQTQLGDSSQELNRNNATDGSVQSSLSSSGSGSNTSNDVHKKGRGPALGYQGKEKIQIIFNECMQPIGDSSTDLANLLGGIAKCGARAPLNVVSWKLMPETNLELMWRDVKHKSDAPDGYKENCLKLIGGHWKKWKSRVKHDFFTPNKDDPEKLLTPPSDTRVNPEQWPELVNYWQRDDVQAQSLKNSNNRKNLEFLPRTGRTSHANVREEMKANKEDVCRANVFIKTRSTKDGTIPDEDTQIVVDRMKQKLNEVPQSEQTDSFKEQVFIDLVGPDGHGSVKTFGGGVSTRDVFGAHSSLRNTTTSDAIERMVQAQVQAQLETKVAERVADLVAEQDAQIEAKLAVHVSNYEKVQMEWFKKLELLLGRELPPPPGHHETRSGSSAGDQGL